MTARWGRVTVDGDSMSPTLQAGDWLVVRWGSVVAVGDVVVLEHPHRPGFLLVKRIRHREQEGWWVEGDNVSASDDSWRFGLVPDGCVRGRAVARYWPRPGWVR